MKKRAAIVGSLLIPAMLLIATGCNHSPGNEETRRITVWYLNYLELDCNQVGSYQNTDLFTMDVRFSGRDEQQIWTCQRDGKLLTCKN